MASDYDSFLNELTKQLKTALESNSKESRELFGEIIDEIIDEKELTKIANELEDYLKKYIRHYFDYYSPKQYSLSKYGYNPSNHERSTRRFENSIRIDISLDNDIPSARVYFDDNDTWRDSLWDGQPKGSLVDLLNDGYRVASGWHRNIHRFGYFEGARFIEAAIMAANKNPIFEEVEIIYEPTGNYNMNF